MLRTAFVGLIVAGALASPGCGVGGGIEPGMPSNLDMSKISDPMAGTESKAPMPRSVKEKKTAH